MNFVTVLFVFVLVWPVMLFTTLPLGVKTQNNPEKGHDIGAPETHDLKKKAIITTILAVIVTFAIYLVAQSGLVDFRQMAKTLE